MPIYKFTVPRSSGKVPITCDRMTGGGKPRGKTSSDGREGASIFIKLAMYKGIFIVQRPSGH